MQDSNNSSSSLLRTETLCSLKNKIWSDLDQAKSGKSKSQYNIYVQSKMNSGSTLSDLPQKIETFFFLLKVLTDMQEMSPSIQRNMPNILKSVRLILRSIKPSKDTTLGALMRYELHRSLQVLHSRMGQVLNADWQYQMSKSYEDDQTESPETLFRQVNAVLRNGSSDLAKQLLNKFEGLAMTNQDREFYNIASLRFLRLSGKIDTYLERFQLIQGSVFCIKELRNAWIFECAIHATLNRQNKARVFSTAKALMAEVDTELTLRHYFLFRGVGDATLPLRFLSNTYFQRNYKQGTSQNKDLFKIYRLLEFIHDQNTGKELALNEIGSSLITLQRINDIDDYLLIVMGLIRWLGRKRQYNLRIVLMREYESTCLRLSNGLTRDSMGMFSS